MKSTSTSTLLLVVSLLMLSLRATPATSLPATELLPIKLSVTTETLKVPIATTVDANQESHSTGISTTTTRTTTRTISTGEVVTNMPTAASTPQVSELETESQKPEPQPAEPAQNNSAERAGECLSIGKYCKLAEQCCTKRCHTYLGKCVS